MTVSMRDLQEALEIGCRAIEQAMAERGGKMAVGVKEVASQRVEPWQRTHIRDLAVLFDVELVAKYLGSAIQEATVGASGRIHFNGKSVPPPGTFTEGVSENRGHQAGVRALVGKYQQALQNVVDLAEGRPTQTAIQQASEAAAQLRPDDPVPKALIAVAQLCQKKDQAQERVKDLEDKLETKVKEDDPEEQLRKRIKMKMRANYVKQRDVLRDFCKYMVLQAWRFKTEGEGGKVTDGSVEKMVDAFLETVGEDNAD